MSTFATDPNMHEAEDDSGTELMVALSRDLANPGHLRVDVIRLGEDDELFMPAVHLHPDQAMDLASHLITAVNGHHIHPRCTAERKEGSARIRCIIRGIEHEGEHVDRSGVRWT